MVTVYFSRKLTSTHKTARYWNPRRPATFWQPWEPQISNRGKSLSICFDHCYLIAPTALRPLRPIFSAYDHTHQLMDIQVSVNITRYKQSYTAGRKSSFNVISLHLKYLKKMVKLVNLLKLEKSSLSIFYNNFISISVFLLRCSKWKINWDDGNVNINSVCKKIGHKARFVCGTSCRSSSHYDASPLTH
jgi:hypothetical protein